MRTRLAAPGVPSRRSALGLAGCCPPPGCRAFYESFLYLVLPLGRARDRRGTSCRGYSGYFSFGHGAFFGAGMYTTAHSLATVGLAVPVDAARWRRSLAALLGVGARRGGVPRQAVRGELFALLTLAVTFVVGHDRAQHADRRRARRLPERGAGAPHARVADRAPSTCWPRRRGRRRRERVRRLPRPLGTGLFAIHDDEDVAEVMGVPTYRYKLVAFAISCALAGVAGGIHALFVTYVTVGRDVHDHRAAGRGADERARRHAPLAGPGGRRGADHRAALRLHRRPDGRGRARGGRAHADAVILFMPDGHLGFVATPRDPRGRRRRRARRRRAGRRRSRAAAARADRRRAAARVCATSARRSAACRRSTA